MCRLLRYLLEPAQMNSARPICEYAIALDVSDRNPATFYPAEDPVVRIQMGRLRKRLSEYYAALSDDPPVRVIIPLGRYQPVIERRAAPVVIAPQSNASHMPFLVSILPLHYLADDHLGRLLTMRFNQLLGEHAQKIFGSALIPCFDCTDQSKTPAMHYVLEGSAQLHPQKLQIALRLVEQNTNAIIANTQLLFPCDANADSQAQFAQEICALVAAQHG